MMNLRGGYIAFRCASEHDWADWMYNPTDPPDPLPAAQPVERMQTGSFNWRGGEGSQTDRVLDAMQDQETYQGRWWAYTRPSTGLIYMQARYYEPETGRFTQPDPVPYGMEMAWGQNNRWTYCANDPVNFSDPSVLWLIPLILAMVFSVGFAIGLYLGSEGFQGDISSLGKRLLIALLAPILSMLSAGTGACWIAGAAGSILFVTEAVAAFLLVFMAGLLLGFFIGGLLAAAKPEEQLYDGLDPPDADPSQAPWRRVYARAPDSPVLDAG